jgi:hypothetical protein
LNLSVSPDTHAGLAVLALFIVVVTSAVAATLWKLRAWRDSGLPRISARVAASGKALQAQLVVLAALAVILGGQAALIGANISPLDRGDQAADWRDVTVAYLYGQVAPIKTTPLSTYNRDLLARVAALPGATHAAATDVIPFSGLAPQSRISNAMGSTTAAAVVTTSAGLLSTLGPRVMVGRDFQMSDHDSAPAVAAISQDIADRLFGSAADAIGRIIRLDDLAGRQVTVVGVTADAGAFTRRARRAETIFLPLSQQPKIRPACLIVKGNVTSQALAEAVSAQRRDEVIRFRSFAELINAEFAREKLLFRIGLSAATFALLVLMVGMCAHAFHLVRAGAKETAVRLALGGRPGAIRVGLIKRAAVPLATGALIGFGGTWLVRAGITSLVGNELMVDPWIPFAVVPLLTVLISVGAVALATRTSTSAEPALRALRE